MKILPGLLSGNTRYIAPRVEYCLRTEYCPRPSALGNIQSSGNIQPSGQYICVLPSSPGNIFLLFCLQHTVLLCLVTRYFVIFPGNIHFEYCLAISRRIYRGHWWVFLLYLIIPLFYDVIDLPVIVLSIVGCTSEEVQLPNPSSGRSQKKIFEKTWLTCRYHCGFITRQKISLCQ